MPASPPALRFPVSLWGRYEDHGSIPISGETGDAGALGGLPQVSPMRAPAS